MTPEELAAMSRRVDDLCSITGATPGDAYRAGRLDEVLLAGTGRGDAAAATLDWLAERLHDASERRVARGMTGNPLAEWTGARVLRELESIARQVAREARTGHISEPTEGRPT